VRGLRAHAKRLARRREAVEHDLERVDDVERLRRIGRMLLAQGSKIPKGASKATLEDWEAGGTLDVELDPALPAKPQAEGFFAKAKRLARGEAVMWARLEETQRALEATRALEAEVDAAETVTLALLEGWMTAGQVLGIALKESTPGAGRAQRPPRLPYLEYADAKGHRVLVGRGAKDNDELTLRVAKPHDLWLHARGVPGAHVVVPLEKGAPCPTELLVDAATLAAWHSDARGGDLVEVTWTERRYVRKPRHSPTGRVTLDREKVMALRVEPDRVARLLAARRER
jgi:predicted ribosome quality control (RQC) complex YloA/Tae2 family protein